MNRSVFRSVFFILGGVFLASCQTRHDEVVAKVGGEEITVSDLQSRLRETPSAYQQYAASAEGRKQFLNLMVRERVILLEAKKSGIQRDPTYRQAIDQFRQKWERSLKDNQDSLLVQTYLRKLRSKDLAASDTEVQTYYEGHRAEFEHPVEVQASHVLVPSEAEAQMVLSRLKNGEAFDRVAKEMSKDPATAARGGKLNPFRHGMLVPEFEAAAFQLKEGELSGIVKTQFGFHIIKKTGEKNLPPRSLADAKEEIRARLERERFDQWVMAKQATLGVKINDQAMAAVKAPAPSAANPVQEP